MKVEFSDFSSIFNACRTSTNYINNNSGTVTLRAPCAVNNKNLSFAPSVRVATVFLLLIGAIVHQELKIDYISTNLNFMNYFSNYVPAAWHLTLYKLFSRGDNEPFKTKWSRHQPQGSTSSYLLYWRKLVIWYFNTFFDLTILISKTSSPVDLIYDWFPK